MRRLHTLLLVLALALGLGAGLPAAASADGRSGDNSAVAINTTDGSSLFRFSWDVTRESGETVDNHNEAVAYSKCEGCRTTAIAFQIVLVSSKPSTVTPTNVAVALNDQCTLCRTFASAHQFVKGTDGKARFTDEGRRELNEVRRALKALKHEDLAPAELDARIDPLVERVRAVLATELVPVGSVDEPDDEDDDRFGESSDLEPDQRPTGSSTREDHGRSID